MPEPTTDTIPPPAVRNRLLTVVAAILVVAALRLSYPVTMPLVVAAFIITAAWPIKPWLERRLPATLSYVGTMLVLFLILAAFILIVYLSFGQVMRTFVEQDEQFRGLYETYTQWAQRVGLPVLGGDGGYDRLAALGEAFFWHVYSVLGYLGFIAVLVILGMPEVPRLAERLREQLHGAEHREVVDAVAAIADKCRRYLGVTLVTSLITGIASALWAFALGLDLALIWGVLNFLLNFIPVIGNIIGIVPPTLYALIQFDGWTMAVIVFIGYAVLQIVISNFIYPLLQGRGMSMPPAAIVISLLFWGWLWGITGALLAVPLTAAIIIICEHFKSTEWVAKLFSR